MKKGFTLIELLAVIVILAIIALIAVPIVLNIIEETKTSASLRNAEMYLDAVELSIASSMLNNKNITDGTYNILENGNICLENYNSETKECEDSNNDNQIDTLKVEVKGKTPEAGSKVVIEESEIKNQSSTNPVDRTEIVLNNKTIGKNEEGSLEFVFCTIERQNSNQYTKGDKIICRDETFYLLSNTDNEIKMISEKNINVTGSGEVKQMDNAGSITFNCVNNQVNYYWKDESGNYKDEYEVETHFGNVFRYVYDRNSNIYPYLNDYKDYLKKTIDLDVIDISIMSLTQIVDFLDITDASQSISGPEWLFAEESWLGSVYGSSDEQYTSTGIRPDDSWNIIGGINAAPSQFYCSSNNTSKSGVRPLVTISTNYIN